MNKHILISKSIVQITPEMAEELLSKNKNTRRLDKAWAHEFALRILEGSFELRQDGIHLDSEGNLINGQHRLSGILEAKKTVSMYVSVWKC